MAGDILQPGQDPYQLTITLMSTGQAKCDFSHSDGFGSFTEEQGFVFMKMLETAKQQIMDAGKRGNLPKMIRA